MKNITSCQRAVGVLAIIIMALVGMLLVQQLANASGNSVEMEITQRNYDWGVSKPGGQGEENAHRSNLDEHFRVETSQQNQRMAFKVFAPGDLTLRTGIYNKVNRVNYNIENAFHKYVDSKENCNNQRTDDAVQMEVLESIDALWPEEEIKTVDMYADLSTMNEGQYSCLVVKLKGALRGPDTHPQWAFVSPEPITWVGNMPLTIIISDDQKIEASSLVGNGDFTFDFHYTILDQGEYCDRSAFAVAPNHPSVHHSKLFFIPESPTARAWYQDRNICFQASITNFTSRAHVYRYRSLPIFQE